MAQFGSAWVGNDMQDTVRSTDSEVTLNVARCKCLHASSAVPLEDASRHGLGHLTRGLRQRSGDRRGGRGGTGPAATGRAGRFPPGDPGAGARGVPHRVHDLRRDRLPGGDRLGRHVRLREVRSKAGGLAAAHRWAFRPWSGRGYQCGHHHRSCHPPVRPGLHQPGCLMGLRTPRRPTLGCPVPRAVLRRELVARHRYRVLDHHAPPHRTARVEGLGRC